MARILAVSGSPGQASRSSGLLAHVSRDLLRHGHEVEPLSLRDLPALALIRADRSHPDIRASLESLEASDGLVVATPVYKAAYSGLLKLWLDVLPQRALTAKTVLPLATAGSLAHALALDYALRPVLASMDAGHVVQGFLVVESQVGISPDGTVTIDDDARAGLRTVVDRFLSAPGLTGGALRRAPRPGAHVGTSEGPLASRRRLRAAAPGREAG